MLMENCSKQPKENPSHGPQNPCNKFYKTYGDKILLNQQTKEFKQVKQNKQIILTRLNLYNTIVHRTLRDGNILTYYRNTLKSLLWGKAWKHGTSNKVCIDQKHTVLQLILNGIRKNRYAWK